MSKIYASHALLDAASEVFVADRMCDLGSGKKIIDIGSGFFVLGEGYGERVLDAASLPDYLASFAFHCGMRAEGFDSTNAAVLVYEQGRVSMIDGSGKKYLVTNDPRVAGQLFAEFFPSRALGFYSGSPDNLDPPRLEKKPSTLNKVAKGGAIAGLGFLMTGLSACISPEQLTEKECHALANEPIPASTSGEKARLSHGLQQAFSACWWAAKSAESGAKIAAHYNDWLKNPLERILPSGDEAVLGASALINGLSQYRSLDLGGKLFAPQNQCLAKGVLESYFHDLQHGYADGRVPSKAELERGIDLVACYDAAVDDPTLDGFAKIARDFLKRELSDVAKGASGATVPETGQKPSGQGTIPQSLFKNVGDRIDGLPLADIIDKPIEELKQIKEYYYPGANLKVKNPCWPELQPEFLEFKVSSGKYVIGITDSGSLGAEAETPLWSEKPLIVGSPIHEGIGWVIIKITPPREKSYNAAGSIMIQDNDSDGVIDRIEDIQGRC